MADLVVAAETSAHDLYLGTRISEGLTVRRPEMLPAIRILRMLRYPDQHAIIWPDRPVDNPPLPGGAAARLRILRKAESAERDRLITDCDYPASVRRCALEAMAEGRPEGELHLIRLHLAGRRGRVRSTMILTEYGREVDTLRGIPEKARRIAERRLRTRWTAMDDALAKLAEAKSDAISLSGPLAHPDGGRGSQRTDRTARAAEKVLEAEARVERLLRWRKVFDQVDADFPAGEIAGDILRRWLSDVRADGHDRGGPSATLRDIERIHGISRSTVNLYKEAIIDRAAYYAAEAGLIGEETDP